MRMKKQSYYFIIAVFFWLPLLTISGPSIGTARISVAIKPGGLTIEDNGGPHLDVLVKNGTGGLSGEKRALRITDARGNGSGWNLVIASSDFVASNRAGRIAAENLEAAVAPAVIVVAGNAAPRSFAGKIGKAGLKLLSAAAGTGMGSYQAYLELNLKVPAKTPSGQYRAVITETLSSEP